ncbi:hypothetical protein IP78_09130 [Brevundimonas sp. AAP58]|nr:hypothetical protein IP78_09130 [Brevundimonas sp. AAP58]
MFAYGFVVDPTPAWWISADARSVWLLAVLYATIAGLLELVFRTERASWRYVSIQDGFALLRSTFLVMLAFLLVAFVLVRAEAVPRSVLLITWVLHLGGLATARLLRRTANERSLVRAIAPLLTQPPKDRHRLLLVGDIGVADSFLRELARDKAPAHHPVAILGLDPGDKGRLVRDVPVRGTVEDLEQVLGALKDADQTVQSVLFLSPPDIVGTLSSTTLGSLKSAGITLLRLPAMSELSAARGSLPEALRELSVEELLARPSVRLDLTRIHELINGRRVLVTGAGGSIGSEICRQVVAFGCQRLIMIDNSEYALFKIGRELTVAHPDLSISERLCDVRDERNVLSVFLRETPEIVFHAAALKHVTLVEKHPCEGVMTNVIGTANVAAAARQSGASAMVMISTDKAVEPSNVMGSTKRLAEAVIRGQSEHSQTKFSVVRFGNVLGSTGSVVPIFRDQIERGGPVTVTDPDVERYFMTIPEAVQLVLHATAQSVQHGRSRPSVFVLDMGQPVKIVDLARNMIALQGLTVGRDIEIRFTGLRPGEKLTEALIDTNENVVRQLDSVFEVEDRYGGEGMTAQRLRILDQIARSADDEAMRRAVSIEVERLRRPSETRVTA